eukprot:2351660-Heterocapsa_arctica.AAC.1
MSVRAPVVPSHPRHENPEMLPGLIILTRRSQSQADAFCGSRAAKICSADCPGFHAPRAQSASQLFVSLLVSCGADLSLASSSLASR